MSSISSSPELAWPWSSYIAWQSQCAEAFYNAPRNLQQSILPWTFAALVVNEDNSSNPAAERAIVKYESYGKQLGRISDALEVLIERSGVEHNDAIDEFLELKARIDFIKHNTESTRFEAVIADLKRLRRKDPARFKDCLDRVAALGHSPVRSLADI
ncbi:ligand-binding receptor (plasmid) [Paraburkholderia caribensis MBA4]|uniref:Ligand-binding receptor n=1 Tax=Paraburkholderia caribensis MBA4 TaxID=1323664 RepID=A0A0P0RR56_9BURK|nr:hypothetical protein [Paraburkholderia caribensis]ALL71304.1 ligand-binding receptor [Paraburkholderia caribensis MBA4]